MEVQMLKYIKFTGKSMKLKKQRYRLWLIYGVMLFVLMGCKSLPKEGETILIEGNIIWVGNEPFAKRVIVVNKKNIYLDIPSHLEPFFKEHIQNRIKLEGTIHYETSKYILRVYKAELGK